MSVHGMKPRFTDQEGYRRWKGQWRALYRRTSATIVAKKLAVKAAQRVGGSGKLQKALTYERAIGFKLMTVREAAVGRWQRILAIRQQIEDQAARLPLDVENCRTVDFHFNRGHNEFPELPMWVAKAKGQTFYIRHMTADVPWTTREIEAGSTKGMLRFRDCDLHIDAQGDATVRTASAAKAALAA